MCEATFSQDQSSSAKGLTFLVPCKVCTRSFGCANASECSDIREKNGVNISKRGSCDSVAASEYDSSASAIFSLVTGLRRERLREGDVKRVKQRPARAVTRSSEKL